MKIVRFPLTLLFSSVWWTVFGHILFTRVFTNFSASERRVRPRNGALRDRVAAEPVDANQGIVSWVGRLFIVGLLKFVFIYDWFIVWNDRFK